MLPTYHLLGEPFQQPLTSDLAGLVFHRILFSAFFFPEAFVCDLHVSHGVRQNDGILVEVIMMIPGLILMN